MQGDCQPTSASSGRGTNLYAARPSSEVIVAFVDEQHKEYGAGPVYTVLPIVLSTYHEDKARLADSVRAPPRARCDTVLRNETARVCNDHFQVYDVRRIWRRLVRQGQNVTSCTIERLMRQMRLQETTPLNPSR